MATAVVGSGTLKPRPASRASSMSFCIMLQSNHAGSGSLPLEHERRPVAHHRRSGHARKHGLDRPFTRDAAALGEKDPFAEGGHLHHEAEVDGELHEHRLPVRPPGCRSRSVRCRRAGAAVAIEDRLVAADHQREAPAFEGLDAPGKRELRASRRPCAATSPASSRLKAGLTVLISM